MANRPPITNLFWEKFFESTNDFLFRPKNFFVTKERKKIITEHNNNNSLSQDYACELEIKSPNYIILDIDCKNKLEQRTGVQTTPLFAKLSKLKNIYFEETINGGYHAIFSLDCGVTILNQSVTLRPDSFVFEFLKKCITYPTTNYKLINTPETMPPEKTSFADFLDIVADLLISAEKRDAQEKPSVVKLIRSCFLQESTGLPSPTDFLRITANDEDSESLDDLEEEEEEVQPGPPQKKRKITAKTDIIREQFETHALECCEREGTSADMTDQEMDQVAAQRMTPRDALRLRSVMYYMKRIFKNAAIYIKTTQVPADHDPKSRSADTQQKIILENNSKMLIINLQDAALRFYKHFKKFADSDNTAIYGDDIAAFFDFLFRADDCAEVTMGFWGKKTESCFSTLVSTATWETWVVNYYCRFINFIETYNQNNGRNSRIQKFSDYNLYRKITLRNAQGAILTEEGAMNEYYKRKMKSRILYASSSMRGVDIFIDLVFFTMSIVKLDADVVHYFLHYVNFVTNPDKSVYPYMCLERFFFSKLTRYDYKFKLIMDEGDRGAVVPVAVFNFKHYHWIKSNTEWFSAFVNRCFPSLDSVAKFINILNTQNSSFVSDEEIKFKQWKNMIPFDNGVFDFTNYIAYEQDDPTPIKITRKETYISNRIDTATALKKYGVTLTEDCLKKYSAFSVFRNYIYRDAVLNPIKREFDILDYLETFESTNLLSLDNYERYSKPFCIYVRCLFGDGARAARMGPFQWVRTMVFFIVLAQGFIRNKMLQTSLNLTGPGSNGKSVFLRMLTKLLGDKISVINASEFFNSNETQQQGVGLEESIFLHDPETERVRSDGFKRFVGDNVSLLKRKLYKSDVGRETENFSSFIACSNSPLKYVSSVFNTDDYDYAFGRRVTLLHLYNILGTADDNQLYEESPAKRRRPNQQEESSEDELPAPRSSGVDSLFSKEGFDLANERVIHDIMTGLMYYILDVIHVFNLPNLNSSSHEIIVSPFAIKRMLGKANFEPLNVLLKEYAPIDEFTTNVDEIDDHTVDFNEFIKKKNYSKIHPTGYQHLCDRFRQYFGIAYTKQSFDSEISKDSEIIYTLYGLVSKRKLSQEKFEQLKNPNKYYDCRTLDPDLPAQKFVNHYIPLGHRYKFTGGLTTIVFETIKKLLLHQKIFPLMKPCVSKDYKNTTLKKMLCEEDF